MHNFNKMSKQDFEQMEMINAFLSDKGKFT